MKPVKFHALKRAQKLKYITKYGNFKNEKDAARYLQLLAMQEHGDISGLQRRIRFVLVDPVYKTKYVTKVLKTKRKRIKKQICVETAVTFDADFIYYNKRGKLRVEVVKNRYTDEAYVARRKLMRYLHQIVVIEN